MVFRISLFLVIALAVVAGWAPKPFEAVSDAALAVVIQHAGWQYLLIVFLTLVFLATSLSALLRGYGSAGATPSPSSQTPPGFRCCSPPAWVSAWYSGFSTTATDAV